MQAQLSATKADAGEQTAQEKLRELCDTVRFDYHDEKSSRARIICAVLTDTLGDDISFKASVELQSFGPANDYNGHRSAAARAAHEWRERVLGPALATAREIQDQRTAQQCAGLVAERDALKAELEAARADARRVADAAFEYKAECERLRAALEGFMREWNALARKGEK